MQYTARLRVSRSRPVLLVLISVSLWLSHISAQAVLFYSTGDVNYNTTAPAGSLKDSGWQFEGLWGGFLGTPIAPKYFITARHIGGSVGDLFVLNGVPYATTAVFDDPDSDLRIWRICGSFPLFAPLYTETNEVDQSFVVIGRGTRRGDPVTTTNLLGTLNTNGWHWDGSLYDGVVRWGENVVTGIANADGLLGNGLGELLQATFDADVGANECHLSSGDSGGAVFLRDGATWKLAGINYAVDGPYNMTDSGPGFDAAIFDAGGLYQRDATNHWILTPDLPISQPGSLYATRISARSTWINSILNGPTPGDDTPTLQSSVNVSQGYVDEIKAMVDAGSKSITVVLSAGLQFYRLRACVPLTIESIHVQDGNLVLRY